MKLAFLCLPLALCFSACATAPALNDDYDPVSQDFAQIDEAFPPSILELNFEAAGERLNGILYQANGEGPHPTVVLLHGYPGNEKNLDLAQSMRRSGYNVLFFHYRGAWASGGSFSFSNVIEDVGYASDMLRERAKDYRVDPDKLILIGHSMGGFAALHGAANEESVNCVAALAPADFGMVAGNPDAVEGLAKGAGALTMLSGWTYETALHDMQENTARFGLFGLSDRLQEKSVLVIAGDRDSVLPPPVFHEPLVGHYAASSEIDLEHHVLPGDHSFSESRIALSRVIIDWADRCTSAPSE